MSHKLVFTVEVAENDNIDDVELSICQLLQQHFIGAVELLDFCASTFAQSTITENGEFREGYGKTT